MENLLFVIYYFIIIIIFLISQRWKLEEIRALTIRATRRFSI